MSEPGTAATRRRATRPAPTPTEPHRPRRGRRRGSYVPWWFAAPAIVLFLALTVRASIEGVSISFTDWNGLSPEREFVGLDNFVSIFTAPDGLGAVTRTFIIAFALVVIQNVAGMLLALALNTKIKSRLVLRTVFFAPAVLSPVVLGYTFKYIVAPDGPVNEVLAVVGVDTPPNWLGTPSLGLAVIIFVIAWQSVGSTMVIYLAGLQGVPPDVLEAASLDGAGPVRTFFSVTLPYLSHAVTINMVLTMIAGLRVFDEVYVLTGGGPANQTQTISTLLVQEAFKFGNYGYGAALAVVLSVVIAVLTAIQFTLLRRQRSA
ncbi:MULTISPECIES: carbohydrate ABC transporter permease [unclassified Actinotalea]|uniref:carbohydrate ABC transporter permease n=1 Tax=unclassified Actinotalea TaxID=2638618 RepID=UPI0015F44147|nr:MULTISPECIES: sugar ABC transporter permease [unclassified Actinotalea]